MVTMQRTSKAPSPLCFAGALQICCSKIKNPVTFCRAKATGWRRDLSRKENSLRPEHLFAGVQKLLSVQAGLLAFVHRLENWRRTSQWRDRAGFTPASLFSPLLCGAPKRDEKNCGTLGSNDLAEIKCARRKSQRLLRSRTASSNISTT